MALHVLLVVIALSELGIEGPDQFGILAPAEFACGDAVIDGVAVGDGADDDVVDELGIGVEVLVGGEFFLSGELLPLFGVTGDLYGEDQDLEIEVIGLVNGGHQRFFRSHHVVGTRLDVCEQSLDDLDAE